MQNTERNSALWANIKLSPNGDHKKAPGTLTLPGAFWDGLNYFYYFFLVAFLADFFAIFLAAFFGAAFLVAFLGAAVFLAAFLAAFLAVTGASLGAAEALALGAAAGAEVTPKKSLMRWESERDALVINVPLSLNKNRVGHFTPYFIRAWEEANSYGLIVRLRERMKPDWPKAIAACVSPLALGLCN
jgi:hypothetical protein